MTPLDQSLTHTLAMAARQNELRLAYVRLAALTATSLLNTWVWLHPEALGVTFFSGWNAAAGFAWLSASAAIAIVLRRGWYHRAVPIAVPIFDALMVGTLFEILLSGFTEAPREAMLGGLVNCAAICALYSMSGTLRLTRASSTITAALSVVMFVTFGIMGDMHLPEILFVSSILLATGMLGYTIAGNVKRAVASEVGRAVLARFLPERVVQSAHEDPMALLATPRSLTATVLVSDLRGFTRYAEGKSPVDVLAFLNKLQGVVSAEVLAHGGTVDKFMGDGMLAVFGAPDPLDDDAGQAIRAAAAMVRGVEQLASAEGSDVRIGVGVHRGTLVAGCLGEGARLEFTIIGDAVNIASRLESETKAAGVPVLVSAAVVAAARGTLPALGVPMRLELKGRSEAVEAHPLARTGARVAVTVSGAR